MSIYLLICILPYFLTHYNTPAKIIKLYRVNLMRDIDFGRIQINLEALRKSQNISINKLACRAEMQRTQLKGYCKNDIQRLDISVLARLCYALDCDITDILEYIPPKKNSEH